MKADHVLSRSETRILEAVVSALAEDTDGRESVEQALRLIRRLPPSDRKLLRLLLRAIEHAVPLFTGRLRRFTALGRQEQQAYLRGWARSRFAMRRQGYAALKAVAMLAYYGREASWPAVGYDGPWLGRVNIAVLPAPNLSPSATPQPIPPTRDRQAVVPAGVTPGRDVRADLVIRAQVCVIGSGAGGAAAAARLAKRGIDVVMLEAGGHLTAADFNQRELDMLPLLYWDAGLRATADKAIGILQGKGVGGSTLHNTGLVYPTPRGIADRWRDEHGFPLSVKDLDGHIAEVLSTLRVVPIPKDRINRNNDALRRGAEALGWRHRVPLHNRVECCGCGYCMLGCAYNRKTNAALSYLPDAVAAGARILADCRAVSIRGRSGARRIEAELLDPEGQPTGRRASVHAPVVMVAAGALETPALLLRSGIGTDRVGRGLRLHPSPVAAGSFPERVQAWRGLPQSVVIEEFASFYADGRGGFLILPAASMWPGITAVLAPGLGADHRAFMRQLPHLAGAAVLLHDETEGRVVAARDGRPVARYWPGKDDLRALLDGIRAVARIYFAAGADWVQLPYANTPPVRTERELDAALARARPLRHVLALNSVHPQGSCAFGASRGRSAVDPHGEVWGEKGVFVCDTSIFPTSVGVPPQVTTMALAAAVSDYVVEERLAGTIRQESEILNEP